MIYLVIKDHEKIYSIEKMCKVLEISCSNYYNTAKQRYGSSGIILELQNIEYQISQEI